MRLSPNLRRSALGLGVTGCLLGALSPGRSVAQVAFAPAVNVSQTGDNARAPTLVVDRAGATPGRVRLFWYDFTFAPNMLFCSTESEGSWTPAGPCTPNVTASWLPDAVADGAGSVHLVWRDNTAGRDDIFYSVFDGAAWSVPANISDTVGSSRAPKVAVDPRDGTAHVLWLDDSVAGVGKIWEAHHDGVSWLPSQDTGLPYAQGKLIESVSVAMDSTGTMHAVWFDAADVFKEVYHSERPPGGPWSPPTNLSNTPVARSDTPSIAVALDDTLHVVFIQQEPVLGLTYRVVHASRAPASAWTEPVVVSGASGDMSWPVVALGADGVPRIAWREGGVGDGEIFFVSAPGELWQNVSQTPGASDVPAMVIDGDGDVHLAWQERDGVRDVFYTSTRLPPQELDIRVAGAGGDVVVTWAEGSPPFRVTRSEAPDRGGDWLELTPPGGIMERTWVDAGALRDGAGYHYLAEEIR